MKADVEDHWREDVDLVAFVRWGRYRLGSGCRSIGPLEVPA
jgi:hypothetical protein